MQPFNFNQYQVIPYTYIAVEYKFMVCAAPISETFLVYRILKIALYSVT